MLFYLNVHYCQDSFVKNGVSHVLAGVCVGGHLSQSVVHYFRLGVIFAQNSEKPQDLDLEEGRYGHQLKFVSVW